MTDQYQEEMEIIVHPTEEVPTALIYDLADALCKIKTLLPSTEENKAYAKCLELLNHELNVQLAMHEDLRTAYYSERNKKKLKSVPKVIEITRGK